MSAADHAGFLVPDTWQRPKLAPIDLQLGSLLFGFTLALFLFTSIKAGKQSMKTWKRSGRITPYVIMVWTEILASATIAFIAWLFMREQIHASFWLFFFILVLWCFQIQLLLQIIINRIGLLILNKQHASKIKWVTAAIITLINVSVFIVWIPAQLQISPRHIYVNQIWDRIEKAFFAIVDACLNGYFIHLVKHRLVDNGLTKYEALLKLNMVMVVVSVSLDIILIGTMSIRSPLFYVAFHPVVYLLKLSIEMNMAEFIAKVVKASSVNGASSGDAYIRQPHPSGSNGLKSGTHAHFEGSAYGKHTANVTASRAASQNMELGDMKGIRKDVSMQVVVDKVSSNDTPDLSDTASRTSSTRELHHHRGINSLEDNTYP